MKVRRTISIDKSDLDALKPFLDANGNNLSLALRQLIDEHRQRINLNKITGDQKKLIILRNQIIENRIATLVPVPLIKWLLRINLGVPPLGIFRVIMEKYTRLLGLDSLSINDYVKMVNTHGDIFGYQISQHIDVSPDSKSIRITFEAEDSDHLRGTVVNYSCLLAHHPLRLKTKRVIESPNLIIIDYEQCSNEEEAYRSVVNHFGYNQTLFDEIQNNIQFWRNAVNILKADNYEDIIISRDIFHQLLMSRDFSDQLNNLISIIYGVSVENTDYKDIIRFIEKICNTNGLIHRIEQDNNEIRIYHKFNDADIIRIVNDTIIKTLEISGQHFMLKKGDKITILSQR
ncbi:hypothetical protein ANME2D_00328 [Candidatus Methanoperedens nitroreducens]|uniref:Uncharacterized protein n=1 Tax=Candidatus Methanoperedens nitratireducens TaxID=1392998 RepID=A0A062V9N4_9EURY|nr:hypothetical protein [Candidatus Methanoperedens nitroreducens]KCZ73263.1 hypothetical protein ANME2D_00328 [Candidatus Methanoperedens nitroreducens]MDJ1422791.1 hypothetical protein [Candidatus Methanoperedens sp.]